MNKPSPAQIQATHPTAAPAAPTRAEGQTVVGMAAATGRSTRLIGRPDDLAVEDAAQDTPIEDIAATEQEAETVLAMAETVAPEAAELPSTPTATATPTTAPSSSAGYQDIKPLWIYGGAGLGLLAVAAAGSGSTSAAAPTPAPAPAPADTTPPTAPTASTVAVHAVKAPLGTGSDVSVHLSSVPADAATITLTLIDSSNPAHTYTHQLTSTGTGTGSGAAATQSYTFANVPDGAYTTTVVYTDAAGNPATFSTPTPQALDTVVGSPTVSTPPSYDPATQASSLNVTLPTDAKVGDTLTITVHDVSGALADRLVTHPLTAQEISASLAQMDLSAVLVNGTSYTASTTLTDAALNVSTPASTAPFTVDTVTTVPTLLQAGSTNAISGNTVFSSAIDITGVETGARVQYEVYQGQPTGTLTTLTTAAATGTTYTIPSQTSNGNYSVHVVVTDAAGNTASSITSYTLQGINGPTLSFTDTAPAGTPSGDPLLADHLTNVLPVLTLTPDAAMPSSFSITEYSTDNGQTWGTTLPTWTPNTRVDVSVRYTDPSSGLSTLPSNTFATYDHQAPSAAPLDLGLTSTKVGNNQSDIVVSLSNIPADALANLTQVELLSNGQPVANLTATITPGTTGTTSTYTFSSASLSDATYTARVSYTDAAGNTTLTPVVSSASITPDTTAPVAAPVLNLASPVAPGAATRDATLAAISPDADATRVEYRVTDPATGSFSAWSAAAPVPSASTQSTGPQNYTVEARQLDAAGNASPSASLSYMLDNFVGSPSLGAPSYSPANKATTLNLSLPADAQAGDLLHLTVHDVTANLDTVVTYTVQPADVAALTVPVTVDISSALLTSGNSYTVTGILRDAAGNVSATPAAVAAFTFDNITSAQPLAVTLGYLAATQAGVGGTATCLITLDPAATFAGDTLVLHIPGLTTQPTAIVLTAQDIASGSLAVDVTGLLSSGTTYSGVSAQITDAAGNTAGALTLATPFTFDNSVGTPSALALSYNPATPNTAYLDLTLPADALAGDRLTLTLSDTTQGTLQGPPQLIHYTVLPTDVAGAAALRLDLKGLDPALVLINGNSYAASVTLTDAALNVSAPATAAALTFDNLVLAPVVTLNTDTGVLANDGITKLGAYTVTGLEPGASTTVAYSTDGTTWSTTQPSAVEGLNTFYVRQTDAAGNVSPVVLGSPNLSFTLDTAAPVAPTIALSSDTGSVGDLISSLAGITVGAIEANTTVTYSIDGTAVLTPGALGSGLADGAHTVVVSQTDLAGNVTASSLSYILDTVVAPLGLALVSDNGVFNTDKITSVGSVKLVDAVTGLDVLPEAGALVEYGTLVNGSLSWSSAFTPAMGINDVWVRQTDLAGNVSVFDPITPALHFTLVSANAAPTVVVADTGSVDTPTVVTQTATINVTPGVAGSTDYTYSLDNGATWTSVMGLPMTGGPIAIPTAGDGTYTVLVHSLEPVTAVASNNAQVTFIQDTATTLITAALTVDTVNPLNDPNGTGAADALTRNGSITVSNVDPNLSSLTYTYTLNGLVQPAVTVAAVATPDPLNPAQFIATLPSPTLGDGAYTVSVYQTDKAGNTTAATPVTVAFTLDTTLALPVVTLVTDTGNLPANPATALDGITNLSDLLVANLKPGAVVDFTVTDSLGNVVGIANNTVPVNANNTADILSAINTIVSPDGAYTITVTQTDLAGNQQSQALPLLIDTQISTLSVALVTDTASALNPVGTTTDLISQVGDVLITGFDPHVDVVNYTFTLTDSFGTVLLDPITNLPYPTITGSFVPTAGATSHTLLASTVGLSNGTYTVSLDQIDKAGNSTLANGTTSTFTFTYDTLALSPVIKASTDSFNPDPLTAVATATDTITNVSDLLFSNLEVGAAVKYTIVNALTGVMVGLADTPVAVDPANGTAPILNPIMTITQTGVAGMMDGTYAVTVTQTDLAGHTSTTTSTYVIDTLINPLSGAVSLDGINAPIPDGQSTFDHVGTLGQISLNGLDPNVDLVYYTFTPMDPLTGLPNGTPPITGSVVPPAGVSAMTLSLTDPTLALLDGAYTVNFWQVDKAGNSSLSMPVTMLFTLDTQTVVPSVVLANDTGDTRYNTGTLIDGITADPTPKVQAGAELGGVIEYSLDGATWVSAANLPSLLTGDGAYGFYVRQTDLVGNVATSGNTAATGGYTFILDTAKPALTLAADPLSSTMIGGVLYSSTGAINVTSGVDPHASTLAYSLDGGLSWAADLATLPATITAQGIPSGQTITVDVVQIDAAGNGNAQLVPGGKDSSITLVFDNTTPAPWVQMTTDSIPDPLLLAGSATGRYSVDGVTNVSTITAAVTEAGATLSYSVLDATGAVVVDALGAPQTTLPWSGTYTAPPVDPLTHQVSYTVYFQQTDLLGNMSPVTSIPITLDIGVNAPTVSLMHETSATAITLPAVLTSYIGQLYVAPAEVGGAVLFSSNNGGTWQDINAFTPQIGRNNLLVHQIDAAGNVSPDTPFTFDLVAGYTLDAANANTVMLDANNAPVVDTTFPALPSVSFTDAGLAGDFVTNNTALTFSAPQNPAGLTSVIEYSADGGITWAGVGPGMLALDQTYNLLVRESAFDPVANVTHCSAAVPFNVTVDTTAPALLPWSNAAELFTSTSGTSNSVAVLQLHYAEGASVDPTNLAAFNGAAGLGYTTSVVSSGIAKDGLAQLGMQSDGTTLIELQFTETVLGSFTQATITPVGQLSVSDVTGNSTAPTPTVDLTTLGLNWVIWQNLP